MPIDITRPFSVLGCLVLMSCVLVVGTAGANEADLRLVTATEQRDMRLAHALVGEGIDVNARRSDGATALLWAAHWDDLDTVHLLLSAGADPNAAEDHGLTPLAMACENASVAMVDALLKAGADPNAAQVNGVTLLMTAAKTGSVRIVDTLLAHQATVNAAIPSTGQTALMWATAERHGDVMEALIAAGADADAKSTIGFTPLLFAARNGDIAAAKLLLRAGAGVNDPGSDGTHALPLAIVSGHEEMAQFLLAQGADPDSTIYGVGAIHAAAGSVDMWLRDWFRIRQADDSRATPGMSPDRRVALVAALLDHGADPDARITTSAVAMSYLARPKRGAFEPFACGTGDLRGATPLFVAAWDMHSRRSFYGETRREGTERPDIIRLLLAAGADPMLTAVDQTTPLMAAAGLGRSSFRPGKLRGDPTPDAEAAVRLLIEAGADIDAVNEADFTALHGAAFKGLNEVIEYLVEQGAVIDAQDFRGRTAFRMAEGSKQSFQFQAWPETAELLATLGADTSLGMRGEDLERQLERDATNASADESRD